MQIFISIIYFVNFAITFCFLMYLTYASLSLFSYFSLSLFEILDALFGSEIKLFSSVTCMSVRPSVRSTNNIREKTEMNRDDNKENSGNRYEKNGRERREDKEDESEEKNENKNNVSTGSREGDYGGMSVLPGTNNHKQKNNQSLHINGNGVSTANNLESTHQGSTGLGPDLFLVGRADGTVDLFQVRTHVQVDFIYFSFFSFLLLFISIFYFHLFIMLFFFFFILLYSLFTIFIFCVCCSSCCLCCCHHTIIIIIPIFLVSIPFSFLFAVK